MMISTERDNEACLTESKDCPNKNSEIPTTNTVESTDLLDAAEQGILDSLLSDAVLQATNPNDPKASIANYDEMNDNKSVDHEEVNIQIRDDHPKVNTARQITTLSRLSQNTDLYNRPSSIIIGDVNNSERSLNSATSSSLSAETDDYSGAVDSPTTPGAMGSNTRRSRRFPSVKSKRIKIGTKISEGHANYVLMYDMLTGIRIAVSRCVAKPQRALLPSDFREKYKLTFDILGNELTPSSRYEFKFKDYAPWVFRSVREFFKIEAADYLVSLTGKYVLSELGSSGKSGSFFYFSQDYRFIIKTIHHTEHKVLFNMLPLYYEHIKSNPNTLLSRYLGLHRVKLPRGKKIHFVVMGNVFPPNKDIHQTFDLKGSVVGREVSDEDIKNNQAIVMKDLNWTNQSKRLELGPLKHKLLMDQLKSDVEFLTKMRIMDYSLLTGIHFMRRGNSENIRDKSLSVFEPNAEKLARQPVSSKKSTRMSDMRRLIAESETTELGTSGNKLPEKIPNERRDCVFFKDDGGFRSTDMNDQPLEELYFLGIIDILTPYNYTKRIEHGWKSLRNDKHLISAVNPVEYGQRFLKFVGEKVVGGGGGGGGGEK